MSQRKNKSKNKDKRQRKIKNNLKSAVNNNNAEEALNDLDNIFKSFLKL